MALTEAFRRIRAFLDSDRQQAEEEANRRVYVYNVADLDEIYYDELAGFPNRAWGTQAQSAVAGELSYVDLLNPTNSGVDLLPDLIIVSSVTAQPVQLRIGALIGASTLSTASGRRDTRAPGTTVGQVRFGSEAAVTGGLRAQCRVLAATTLIIDKPSLLCLGSAIALHVVGTVVNTTLEVSYFWREVAPGRGRIS